MRWLVWRCGRCSGVFSVVVWWWLVRLVGVLLNGGILLMLCYDGNGFDDCTKG